MPKLTKPRGRPFIISEEICDEICARLASGEPVTKITQDEGGYEADERLLAELVQVANELRITVIALVTKS